MLLARVEAEEIACKGANRVIGDRPDPRLACHDEDERCLHDLVVAELLSGLERDEDDAALPVL